MSSDEYAASRERIATAVLAAAIAAGQSYSAQDLTAWSVTVADMLLTELHKGPEE